MPIWPDVRPRSRSREPGVVSEHVEIQITCGSAEEADAIAGSLVERRLVACAQAMPIRSVYVWKGQVEHDDEVLVLLKTRADRFDAVADHVLADHSYDLPAITSLPMTGTRAYLDWIDESVGHHPV